VIPGRARLIVIAAHHVDGACGGRGRADSGRADSEMAMTPPPAAGDVKNSRKETALDQIAAEETARSRCDAAEPGPGADALARSLG